jgi:hypothetical protein
VSEPRLIAFSHVRPSPDEEV